MKGRIGSSQPVHFYCACSTGFLVAFLFGCYRVSVLDASHTWLSEKQGGGLSFSLIPISEGTETVPGPRPVFPALVSIVFVFKSLHFGKEKKKSVAWEKNLLPVPEGLEEGARKERKIQ